MAYALIDDQLPDHPKIMQAGPEAAWLYVCGLAYCTRLLTDGFIPAAQVNKLSAFPADTVTLLVTRLRNAQLWEEVDGGYRVHDFAKYNPTAAAVREKRAKAAERQERWRLAHLASIDKGISNGVTNALPTSNAVTDRSPRPSHSSTSPKGEEEAPDADAPAAAAEKSRKTQAAPKPPKVDRVADFIDAVRAVGVEDYIPTPGDTKLLSGKSIRQPLSQVAEVYAAIAQQRFGDDWQRDHLSVATAVNAWNGYQASKAKQNGQVYRRPIPDYDAITPVRCPPEYLSKSRHPAGREDVP